MKKLNLFRTTIPVLAFIILLCLTFGCQQQVEKGLTEEEAKHLYDKSMEILNEGNLSLIDEVYAPNFVAYSTNDFDEDMDLEALIENNTNTLIVLPDYQVIVEELIVKDNVIIIRWISTGTNTGTLSDMPPTGKKTRVEGITINHVVDGKIVDERNYYDNATALTQHGYTITPPSFEEE